MCVDCSELQLPAREFFDDRVSNESMSKISLLVVLYVSENSGASKVVQTLINRLTDDHFRIVLVLPKKNEFALGFSSSINIHYVPIPRISFHVLFRLTDCITSFVKLRKIICEERIEVIHCNGLLNLVPALVARQLNVPLVWHIHELEVRPKPIFTVFLRLCQLLADRIICVSDSVANLFPKSSKVQVICNGVDDSYLKPVSAKDVLASRQKFGFSSDSFVVTILGRIVPIKGIEWFIRLAEEFISRKEYDVSKVKFLIVGGFIEGHESYLDAILKRLGNESLHGQVVYLGEMDDPKPILRATDVLVQCSIIAESFGLSLIEAMAMGKPVIASNSGGPVEIVDDEIDGFLVDPKDVCRRADILDLLYHDRERYRQMGNAARKKVIQRYGIDAMASKFSSMYQEPLLSRSSSI